MVATGPSLAASGGRDTGAIMTTTDALARLIRRTDTMGYDSSDCTSDLALIRADALLALRLLGFGWNCLKAEPVALKEQS